MSTILGLLGVLVFMPVVVTIAAVITWLVVKLSPSPHKPEQES